MIRMEENRPMATYTMNIISCKAKLHWSPASISATIGQRTNRRTGPWDITTNYNTTPLSCKRAPTPNVGCIGSKFT